MAVQPVAHQSPETQSPSYWPPPQGQWTYDDYARLPDNGMRYEVIQGDLYMSPAPTPKHQRIIAALYGYLWQHLRKHPLGEAFFAPIDLVLPDLANPVQPDLLFIEKEGLDCVKEKFIEGVPDLIVEVLSPGNVAQDRRIKFQLYAAAGVREYWVIDPEQCMVEINVLRGEAYASAGRFTGAQALRSEVLTGFSVRVEEICQ